MLNKYNKQQLYFDKSSDMQVESYEFLKLCGHKTTKYLSFIIHDFLNKHGVNIKECTADDIKKMMEFLDTPIGKQRTINSPATQENQNTQEDFHKETINEINKSSETDDVDEMDDMRDALAAFS